ncbi:MAG: aminotransferase DegT [Nitrospinae bacterium CG11_big_fil_rev_8_21_14_0_20_56_8]|nr:MAG: aminotransferase DegT [Nitrospinae bacterium CG11_big_fil_rev_8_21_14_0_20_56_8]
MIPFAKPSLGEEEARAAAEAVLSGWVTQGPRVAQFEADFARTTGAAHACAVSNCTAALSMGLRIAGVRPGDAVLTVSHSFIATANSVRFCGAEPVFVDIQPETFNLDPDEVERVLREDCERREGEWFYKDTDRLAVGESPWTFVEPARRGRIAALMPVHQLGMPCDMPRLLDIARRYHLPVVEDAACALGSEISFDGGTAWEPIGKPHGDFACFSFHPRKVITTGDGGMLTSAWPEGDRNARLLRHHGMGVSDLERHESRKVVFENYVSTGFNFRLTDIQAAVGIEQLKRLDAMIESRRRGARLYHDLLADLPWLRPQREIPGVRTNWQTFAAGWTAEAPVTAKELMQKLLDRGIATRRSNMNAHQEAPYRPQNWSLPVSEHVIEHGIALPMYSDIAEEQIRECAHAIKEICGK